MGEITFDTLHIHITGNISPETLGAKELADVLTNLQDAILPSIVPVTEVLTVDAKLSLSGLSSGTLTLTFSSNRPLDHAMDILSECFHTTDFSSLPDLSRRAVLWLGKWSRRFDYQLEWIFKDKLRGTITPELELKLNEHRIGDAVHQIRERFGEHFDAIDPDAFMAQVRGE